MLTKEYPYPEKGLYRKEKTTLRLLLAKIVYNLEIRFSFASEIQAVTEMTTIQQIQRERTDTNLTDFNGCAWFNVFELNQSLLITGKN